LKASARPVRGSPKPAPAAFRRTPYPDAWFALALLVATLVAYQPAWHGGMVWDDDAHITRAELRSLDGLWRIWTEPAATQQYYPLMHSVFWLQYHLWGDDTLGYHLVNIVLHVVVAILFMLVLRRLHIPGAYLAALIFALHPVHVESVAWITELKNTLSGALYLGAALAYLRFDERRERQFYWLAFALFVLALFSKAVTATLPAALLLVFWWQRGRLEWRRDVVPLVPFFVFGVVIGLFIAYVERAYIGAEGAEFELSIIERGLIAGRVVWFYASKLVWPANLMFFYPRWEIDPTAWWQYLFGVAAVALLVVLWRLRQQTRGPLTAVLFFGGTLFPVLGFINVYPFVFSFVADHFQYLASLGLIAMGAAGAAILAARQQSEESAKKVLIGLSLLLAGVLGTLTWQRCHQFANVEVLYRETLDRNPTAWLCHYNLAIILYERKEYAEAARHYQESSRYNPNHSESHFGLAMSLRELGQLQAARVHLQETLRCAPGHKKALYYLPEVLIRLGQFEQAVAVCQEVIRLSPNNADAYNQCGFAYEKLGQLEQAVASFRHALRLAPNAPGVEYYLASALARQGHLQEAIEHLQRALELQPDFAAARDKLMEVKRAIEQKK
jgi:tetratricopeptide (TPR) repeat protein